jgi:hypothetical protein
MNAVAAAKLSSKAFAQFAEVDAPLVESERAGSGRRGTVVFRRDGPAGFAP